MGGLLFGVFPLAKDAVADVEGFQSSPDPKAGRYLVLKNALILSVKFQSSPDPKAGRYAASGKL